MGQRLDRGYDAYLTWSARFWLALAVIVAAALVVVLVTQALS